MPVTKLCDEFLKGRKSATFGCPFYVFLSVDFLGKKIDVQVKPRQSLEAQARQLRYEALAPYCHQHSALLTGHHNDDQVETYLLQLKRGAGIKGLSAMGASRSFSSGVLLRPLLPFTRAQLTDYALAHQLPWIEDESNLDQAYDRNFLRNNIIPQLSERWPGFGKAVVRSASLCAEAQLLCDEIAEQDLQAIKGLDLNHEQGLAIVPLLELSAVRRNNLLRHWIAQQGALLPSQKQLQQIWDNLALSRNDACGLVSWAEHQMRRFQDRLYLLLQVPAIMDDIQIDPKNLRGGDYQVALAGLSCHLRFEYQTQAEHLRLPLCDEALSVRFNGSGAICQPLGRNGSRKFKKLMQEYQIPTWQRQQIPLIYYNEQLVAAIGYWLDSRYISEPNAMGLHIYTIG